jgi:hypothetical protein
MRSTLPFEPVNAMAEIPTPPSAYRDTIKVHSPMKMSPRNVSLQSLVLEARAGRVPKKSPEADWQQRKMG